MIAVPVQYREYEFMASLALLSFHSKEKLLSQCLQIWEEMKSEIELTDTSSKAFSKEGSVVGKIF